MRPIDADALKGDYVVTSTTTNSLCNLYVSMEQIAMAPTVEPASPWHRVEEPPKGYGAFAACCVYYGKIYWFKAIYLDGKWLREMDGVELPVNYWMEIPEPPKEEV